MTTRDQLGMLRSVLGRGLLPRLSAFFVLLSVFACSSGTETGNPSFTGSLSYTGHSSAPDDYGVGKSGRIAEIDQAWFALDRVQTLGCDDAGVFDVPALGVGDHAAGNHNMTRFTAKASELCRVRLPFLEVSEDAVAGVPAALRGHALLLSGTLADGTAFTIVSDARPVVELDATRGGFAITAGEADLLLAFDFAHWLGAVDFAAAIRNAEDEIVISGEENSELLAAFDAQLASGVALYRDGDADGVIDPDPELLAAPR